MRQPMSVANDPRAWFDLVREQLEQHQAHVKEMERQIPKVEARDVEFFRDLYYQGWLMGQDVLMAAKALILSLDNSVDRATGELLKLPLPTVRDPDAVLFARLPWDRVTSVQVAFAPREDARLDDEE